VAPIFALHPLILHLFFFPSKFIPAASRGVFFGPFDKLENQMSRISKFAIATLHGQFHEDGIHHTGVTTMADTMGVLGVVIDDAHNLLSAKPGDIALCQTVTAAVNGDNVLLITPGQHKPLWGPLTLTGETPNQEFTVAGKTIAEADVEICWPVLQIIPNTPGLSNVTKFPA